MQIFPWSWKKNFLYWQLPNYLSLKYNTVKRIFSSYFSCPCCAKIFTTQTNTTVTRTKTASQTLILFNLREPLGPDWMGDVCVAAASPTKPAPMCGASLQPAPTSPSPHREGLTLSASLSPLLQWTTTVNQEHFSNADQRDIEPPAFPSPMHQWYPRAEWFLQHGCDSRVLGVSRDLSLPGAAQTAQIHSLLKKQPEPEMDTPFLQSKERENK